MPSTSTLSNSQLLQLGHKAVVESENRPVSAQALTNDAAYKKLRQYHDENAGKLNIVELFNKDADRFNKFQ